MAEPPSEPVRSVRHARRMIRWRWAVMGLCVLAAAAAGSGIARLQYSADYRAFFGPDNPELAAYDALERVYTNTDNALLVVMPGADGVFTRDALAELARLTEAAWQLPYASRVDSLTNFQDMRAEGDEVTVTDLVPEPDALGDAGLARVRDVALSDPALAGRLVAYDGRTSGVLVTFQFPGEDHTHHLPEAVGAIRRMKDDVAARHPDWTVGLTGVAVLSDAITEAGRRDMGTLVPAMYLLIVLAMLALLRSVWGTVAILLVVTLSAATALGLAGWLGIRLSPTAAIAPVVILTLAIADCVHILLAMFQRLAEGDGRDTALAESLRVNAEPVFLTSLTTAIGFLSLNFSDAPPLHDLGNITAMGVGAAWVYAMTFLPAFAAGVRFRPRPVPGAARAMERFGDFVVARRRPLLWGGLGAALLAAALIPRLELDDRFVRYFGPQMEFRVDTEFAARHLTGPYPLEFSVPAGDSGAISEPAYIERLDAFAAWLRAQPEVTHVFAYSDLMKRINRAMHGDDPAWYRVPDDRELAAQYLLLYELSVPYGLDLNSQIDVDRSATRLTATLDDVSAARMRAVKARAEAWLRDNAPPQMAAEATGAAIMFAFVAQRNIRSMLWGTALAFGLIALVLVAALRSVRLGLVSLLSNGLPVLMAFGVWAVLVGRIGIIASIITATTLGLIVDDTVHILSKFRRARREHCINVHDSVRFAFRNVGTALWVTTAILVAGFAVLAFSAYRLNADMGVLTAITLAAALAVDFLVLPPLLMAMDPDPECPCPTCRCAPPDEGACGGEGAPAPGGPGAD